jgi:hypothetical protein
VPWYWRLVMAACCISGCFAAVAFMGDAGRKTDGAALSALAGFALGALIVWRVRTSKVARGVSA